ncbi:MAG: nicotinate (nicotinamide) nucleotide adenylyltransferase [Crocinitomicaceae bacterium]|nr:nicotinate (nicotinamide) nucleotide adenylyltransferase [Crocinitomicaceae bacterium]MDG1777149.1 nicotinate (nicotinamide) nucleotide adenylyltransferase [Crocinitomicaceae bacterium]
MNIGLYFGTFNPIHIGHLKVANYMAEHTDLEEIWFVVSPHSPQKEKKALLEDHHRLEMVRIAIEDNRTLKVSDVEFELPQPNYTATTLSCLQEKYPKHSFSLLMGEDNLRGFHTWFNYERILANHKIYVYPRTVTCQEPVKQVGEKPFSELYNHQNVILCKGVPKLKISSSFIRESIEKKKDVRSLLPEKVYTYIINMNFYK